MTKATIPALTTRDPRYAVVKAGSTVLGQVRSVTPNSTANRDKKTNIPIGAVTASTFYGPPDYTHKVDFELYAATANDEAMRLLGNSPLGAGGSAGLDATKSVASLKIEIYDEPSSSGELEGTYEMTNFVPLSLEVRADASTGDALVLSISGECDTFTFTAAPAA